MDYINLLKSNNIKITKARLFILNLLNEEDDGLSADDVLKKLNEQGNDFDLSTIYRNLEKFSDMEITEKLNLGDNRYIFKLNKDKHKHVLKCSECSKEIEIDCPLSQVKEYIKNKTGFVMSEHDFVIEGICKNCKDKK
jgi:Fur family transcriptional regulator, ferric uptake regulator